MARYTLKIAHESAKVSKGNSKMPGKSYPISAKRCNVGGELAKVKGSVCNGCYALRLQKLRPSVNKGWETNFEKLIWFAENNPEAWIVSMVHQIGDDQYFRWFDSGDLPSEQVLDMIAEVCRRTPKTRHWLPTKELKLVLHYGKALPDNLIVRVSAPMVDQKPVNMPYTSMVYTKIENAVGHICPARKQGNSCGDCRACWSFDVKTIAYHKH